MKKRFFMLVGLVGLSVLMYETYTTYLNDKTADLVNKEIEQTPTAAGNPPSFQAFDATSFAGTHSWVGNPINLIFENELLGAANNYSNPPDEKRVRQALSKYSGADRLVIAIPSWNILKNNKLDPMAKEHAKWYMDVMIWAKDALPNTNLGFLGLPMTLWDVLTDNDLFFGEYSKGLDLIMPVLKVSDSLYPTFDVRDVNAEKINTIGAAFVMVAKTLKKPFYPFMWHKATSGVSQNQILPNEIIEQQCKFLRSSANGVIWWSEANELWDGGVWYQSAKLCFS